MDKVLRQRKIRFAIQATTLFLIAIGCMFAWCAIIDIHNWHEVALVLLAGLSGITGTLCLTICVDFERRLNKEKGVSHDNASD